MKKVTIVLLLALFFISSQSFGQFHLKAGPAVGLNLNIASGDLTQNTYTGFGILLGGQVDMSFTPMIGLITNVNFFDSKSHSFTDTNNDVEFTEDVSVGYLQIQPLFKLSIPTSGFYFFAGPGIGLNIQGKDKQTTTQGNNNPQVNTSTLKNLATRFELKVGSGFDINLGPLVDLTPEFSFAYGLTDVFTKGRSWKVMTFNLSTIVKFKAI